MCGCGKLLPIYYTDDDDCCRDPIEASTPSGDQLLTGAFTNVYQKAMREDLPETESAIKNSIDYKLSMRQVGVAEMGVTIHTCCYGNEG